MTRSSLTAVSALCGQQKDEMSIAINALEIDWMSESI